MPSCVVQAGDAQRAATAVTRYQLGQPRVVLIMFTALVVVVGLEAVFAGSDAAIGTAVVVLVVYLLVALRTRARIGRALVAGGYRTGATLDVTLGDEWFRLAIGRSSAQHDYRQIADVWGADGLVLVRLHAARTVLVIPHAALGDQGLARLRTVGGRP